MQTQDRRLGGGSREGAGEKGRLQLIDKVLASAERELGREASAERVREGEGGREKGRGCVRESEGGRKGGRGSES